jgi:hypothetical protein
MDIIKFNTKPDKKNFGWHEQLNFDDERSGWLIEDGEEKYYDALREWREYRILELCEATDLTREQVLSTVPETYEGEYNELVDKLKRKQFVI